MENRILFDFTKATPDGRIALYRAFLDGSCVPISLEEVKGGPLFIRKTNQQGFSGLAESLAVYKELAIVWAKLVSEGNTGAIVKPDVVLPEGESPQVLINSSCWNYVTETAVEFARSLEAKKIIADVFDSRAEFERTCQQWRREERAFAEAEDARISGLRREIRKVTWRMFFWAIVAFIVVIYVLRLYVTGGHWAWIVILFIGILWIVHKAKEDSLAKGHARAALERRTFQKPFRVYKEPVSVPELTDVEDETPDADDEMSDVEDETDVKTQEKPPVPRPWKKEVFDAISRSNAARPFQPYSIRWRENGPWLLVRSAGIDADKNNDLFVHAFVDLEELTCPIAIAEIVEVRKEACTGGETVSNERAWDKLILPQKIKEDIQVYCDTLRNFKLYVDQGVPIARGVLFYGPPGCGKTETARVLSKAAGFSFKSLSSADLKVGYIGQAAVAIQKAFDEARSKAPCIVYIDEIEASCPIRAGGQNSVIDREVVAQLLQEMDGIKSNDAAPVFVFAGTNRKDLIDPAVLERFTEEVEIPLPDLDCRIELLRNFLGKISFEEEPQPQDKQATIERLKVGGFTVEYVPSEDDDSWEIYRLGHGQVWNTENSMGYWNDYDEALREGWNILMDREEIIFRIAQATDGMSGRSLKNLVTRAVKEAMKRVLHDPERKVQLHEKDFLEELRQTGKSV